LPQSKSIKRLNEKSNQPTAWHNGAAAGDGRVLLNGAESCIGRVKGSTGSLVLTVR
jgi:hypothetical protein